VLASDVETPPAGLDVPKVLCVVEDPNQLPTLDPTRGVVRVARAVAVGGGALAVSLAGHVAGHAAVPPLAALGPLAVVACVVAWALSSVRWTATSLTGVVLVAQSILHLAFSLAAGDAGQQHTAPMLAGHVVATVIVLAALTHGEALLWGVAESLSLRVWRLLRYVAPPLRPERSRPIARMRQAAPPCWHGHQPPRRGPPLESVTAPSFA
jgi:hypothetical protein